MSTQKKIRKAVFPVAGLGTRFLPATKSMPKEMLPVVDKPLIHYAVEEAKAAGIEQFIFVTGKGKSSIEDYFDTHNELQEMLKEKGKEDLLADFMETLPQPHQIVYVRQPEALGLGHAVWCAREIVGDEPFAVLLSDVLILGETPCMQQMVAAYEETPGNIISVEEIPAEDSKKYGIVDVESQDGNLYNIRGMVEKPAPEDAPSNLAVTGRYIIQPEVFDHLERKEKGAGGEIQLTDALAAMLPTHTNSAFKYEGVRYDCGNKSGWLEANIAYSLSRDDLREEAVGIVKHYAAQLTEEEAA